MNTDDYTFYKNNGFRNTRNEKKTLILDIDDSDGTAYLSAGTEFSIELFEPLMIDKHSEVYLDNFLTFNGKPGLEPDDMAFSLTINEFNNQGNVASNAIVEERPNFYNKLIIPNENGDLNNHHLNILHKSKKFNYICDINPCKLGRISGKITNLANKPIFHGNNETGKFTYTLAGPSLTSTVVGLGTFDKIKISNADGVNAATINLNGFGSSGNDQTIPVTGNLETPGADTFGTFLYTTNTDSTIFYFTANIDLLPEGDNQKKIIAHDSAVETLKIEFFLGGGAAKATFSNVDLNAILRKGSGRFIAEFLIISKEN